MASLSYDDDDRSYERAVACELDAGGLVDVDDERFWNWREEQRRPLGVWQGVWLGCALGAVFWSLIVWALYALAT